jgi:hypothetical protein
MVLNPTNSQLLCMALGIDPKEGDTNEAIGKRVVIWNDMSVRGLDGNLVGGIRIRAANIRPAAPTVSTQAQQVQPAGNLGWPQTMPSPHIQQPSRVPGEDDGAFADSDLPDEF